MKWILLVLAAGFIGQFGRAMAEGILGKARRLFGRKEKYKSPLPDGPSREGPAVLDLPPPPEGESPGATSKKALKAQLKMAKKAAKVKK